MFLQQWFETSLASPALRRSVCRNETLYIANPGYSIRGPRRRDDRKNSQTTARFSGLVENACTHRCSTRWRGIPGRLIAWVETRSDAPGESSSSRGLPVLRTMRRRETNRHPARPLYYVQLRGGCARWKTSGDGPGTKSQPGDDIAHVDGRTARRQGITTRQWGKSGHEFPCLT